MKPENSGKVKFGFGPYCWGSHRNDHRLCVGGWVTNSTAKRCPTRPVLASQAAICVAHYEAAEHEEQLKELGKVESWKSLNHRKRGWDKMPGQEKAAPM